jgi:hypothetical protein
MNRQIFLSALLVVLIVSSPGHTYSQTDRVGQAPTGKEPPSQPHALAKLQSFRVRVHNDSRVPEERIRAAEKVAARVLQKAGIEAQWSDCTVVGGVARSDSALCAERLRSQDLVVYFVDRLEAHFSWADRPALGYSIIPHTHEVATTAFVSYTQIQQLSVYTSAGVEDLLGLAVAHEIGHLLFGTNEHANYGLMRAQWRLRDLEAKAWSEFEFTKDQVKRLRAAILVRMTSEEQAYTHNSL